MAGFALPPQGHIAREMVDMSHLVELLDRRNFHRLPGFREALISARKSFPAGAKSVALVCLRGDDERWLISVGPRGGWKKVWNYGAGA